MSQQKIETGDSLLRLFRESQVYVSPQRQDDTVVNDLNTFGEFSNGTTTVSDGDIFVTSMDFSRDGTHLITTQNGSNLKEDQQEDQLLAIYSSESGKCTHEIPSQKYGCDRVRFTHSNSLVVFASNNHYDHTVRQLDIQNNRFTRYFRGHQHQVLDIAVNPVIDAFCTASRDQSIRFWDSNDPSCTGKIGNVKGFPSIAFDPKGVALAVAGALNTVHLYDIRHYSSGPFSTFIIDAEPTNIANIEFSPDGKYLAASLYSGNAVIMDAFSSNKVIEIDTQHSSGGNLLDEKPAPPSSPHLQVSRLSFTPDSKYLLMGSKYDSLVHAWNLEYLYAGKTNEIVIGDQSSSATSGSGMIHSTTRHGDRGNRQPVHSALWCPKKTVIASAGGDRLSFWIPDPKASELR